VPASSHRLAYAVCVYLSTCPLQYLSIGLSVCLSNETTLGELMLALHCRSGTKHRCVLYRSSCRGRAGDCGARGKRQPEDTCCCFFDHVHLQREGSRALLHAGVDRRWREIGRDKKRERCILVWCATFAFIRTVRRDCVAIPVLLQSAHSQMRQ